MQQRTKVPDHIIEWSAIDPERESEEERTANALSNLAIRFCNLRATMTGLFDFSNAASVVCEAQKLDAELEILVASCPPCYAYSAVATSRPSEEILMGYYYVYDKISIASFWNHYRSIRILVNELLIAQLSFLSLVQGQYSSSEEYERQITLCRGVIMRLSQDICATVPAILGHDLHKQEFPRSVNGYLLLWPLYMAASTDFVDERTRAWVMRRLEVVADVVGILQARAMAGLLKARMDPPVRVERNWEECVEGEGI